jgi:hypothetical protein
VDSQPKTQRSGREKTKYKHIVSNPNYSTGLGWKWGKRGRAPPFIGETLIFLPPPTAARPHGHGPARRMSTRVRVDARSRACTDPRPRVRAMSARARVHARGDPRPCGRTCSSMRTRFLPRPRVNADARGRPDDVRGCPDEKDVRSDIFIQKRLL